MARPAKATVTLVGHQTKDELAKRKEAEGALRGCAEKLKPPRWLNKGQRMVFKFVVDEMAASDVLGNLDVYVLTQFAVATERMFHLEREINEHPRLATDKDRIFARNSYVKDFWRGANELSLSPQSRAKIGALNLSKMEDERDPMTRLISGKG